VGGGAAARASRSSSVSVVCSVCVRASARAPARASVSVCCRKGEGPVSHGTARSTLGRRATRVHWECGVVVQRDRVPQSGGAHAVEVLGMQSRQQLHDDHALLERDAFRLRPCLVRRQVLHHEAVASVLRIIVAEVNHRARDVRVGEHVPFVAADLERARAVSQWTGERSYISG
jgi:hypothetical protein